MGLSQIDWFKRAKRQKAKAYTSGPYPSTLRTSIPCAKKRERRERPLDSPSIVMASSFDASDAWSSEELGAKYEAINQPSLSLEGHYYELCFLPK